MRKKIGKLIFMALPALLVCVAFSTGDRPDLPLLIGNAEIRTEKDAVYIRLRAPKKFKTSYGQFRFVRQESRWETMGTAASFDQPIPLPQGPINPDNFFYPRNGYQEVRIGDRTYKIESIRNHVSIYAKGDSQPDEYFTSEDLPEAAGAHTFRFRYLTSTSLWFDLLIEDRERAYSAGIGYFDIRKKKIGIIRPEQIAPDPAKKIIVSEMSGSGNNVWVGIAYCKEPTCYENGIVLRIGPDGKIARRWYSGEKGVPEGAVIRVMPDGDMLWIVTSKGIALIDNDFIRNYVISKTIGVASDGKLGFTPGKTMFPVTPEIAGAAAQIEDMQDDRYRAKTDAKVIFWLSSNENKENFEDATNTIKIKNGKSVVLRTAPNPDSIPRQYTGLDPKASYKVSERREDWIAVELPQNICLPPESVIFKIEESLRLPANNFLLTSEPLNSAK